MNLIGQTIRRAIGDKSHLNILGIPTHETAQTMLCRSFPDYTFYLLYKEGFKTWDSRFRPLPKNCVILHDKIPSELQFDVILSQNNADQFPLLFPLANQYQIPLINITHTYPYPQMSAAYLEKSKSMKGNVNIFITKTSRAAWGWGENEALVIEHGINTDEFQPDTNIERKPYILSVCNQFSKKVRAQPCGFPLWQQVIQCGTKQSLPWKHLGADEPDFAQPAQNLPDLIQNYQTASIFINTSQLSPIPMSLLEAASCGCGVVSTATCEIPNIFVHGETALLSNNPKELREFCIQLLNNPHEARRLGTNAREMIKTRFNPTRFEKEWQTVFEKVVSL